MRVSLTTMCLVSPSSYEHMMSVRRTCTVSRKTFSDNFQMDRFTMDIYLFTYYVFLSHSFEPGERVEAPPTTTTVFTLTTATITFLLRINVPVFKNVYSKPTTSSFSLRFCQIHLLKDVCFLSFAAFSIFSPQDSIWHHIYLRFIKFFFKCLFSIKIPIFIIAIFFFFWGRLPALKIW